MVELLNGNGWVGQCWVNALKKRHKYDRYHPPDKGYQMVTFLHESFLNSNKYCLNSIRYDLNVKLAWLMHSLIKIISDRQAYLSASFVSVLRETWLPVTKQYTGELRSLTLNLKSKTVLFGIPILLIVILFAAYEGVEKYTSTSSFCGGSCHTMTEQFTAWKKDTHHKGNNAKGMQANCVDCHFLPGEHSSMKAKFEGLRHLAAYLYDKKAPLPIRPVIKDGACLSSGCHSDRKFEEKEIKFAGKSKFKHKVHLTDKALDGQKITCDTCHFKVSENKHFEVPKEICFLCHLKLEKPTLNKAKTAKGQSQSDNSVQQTDLPKNVPGGAKGFQISFKKRPKINFNEGKSKCDICHTIPTKSLQAQLKAGDTLKEPITHQSIKKAGVACESCHFEVIKGHGEIETGNVVSNGCLRCHNRSEKLLVQAKNKTLMHSKHVPAKADCFDCHKVVEHKNRTDHLDFVRNDCSLCHQDQHKYQKLLLAGIPVNNDVSATPHLMYKVNVNCMACHTNKTRSKGHSVRTASGETCAACHKPGHKDMLKDWKKTMAREVADVEAIEKEATDALSAAKGKLDAEKLKKAEKMIVNGSELLNIVKFGNGVHNKKYSINILDQAINNFESMIELIAEGE